MFNRYLRRAAWVLTGLLGASSVLTSLAAEQPLIVGIDKAVQPFALPESDSGLLVDIIRAAYRSQSQPVEFAFMPALRMPLAFKSGMLDVLTDAKPEDGIASVHSHWPVSSYSNAAITLKSRHLPISSIADLGSLRVITFQDASRVLGSEFALMAERNPDYAEMTHMPSNMLTLKRTDVIVSQADIFRFNLTSESFPELKVARDTFEYHDIFPSRNYYWLGFRTEKQRDTFERGVEAIYASGEIDKIFSHYEQLYGTSRDMFISLDCRFLKTHRPPACEAEQTTDQ
jgi:polar amino acid transport system substrate-binding protein